MGEKYKKKIFQRLALSTRFLQRFIKICHKGRKNFADIWPLTPVPVMYIEAKKGFETFFQRDFLEKNSYFVVF